jgi:beta-mannosidase
MKIKQALFLFLVCTLIKNGWAQQSFPSGIIEKEITGWEFRMVGDLAWKPARVPGTIIGSLFDLSDMSHPLHPYFGDNEKLYQWVGEKDWEFRTTINVEEPYVGYMYSLEFGSLDLFADVTINDQQWQHENALYPLFIYKEDEYANPRGRLENKMEIRVVFHSTVNKLRELAEQDSLHLPGGERVYGRKAQYEFGWDWGPKFINMGIRKPVKLRMYPPGYVNLDIEVLDGGFSEKYAGFRIQAEVENEYEKNIDFELHSAIYKDGKLITQYDRPMEVRKYMPDQSFFMGVDDPVLWWPNGMGKRAGKYYEFDFRLTLPGDTHTLAHKRFNYAICKIELIQEKDKDGEAFYFKVNGEKVFAKGANYVPDDSFEPGKNTAYLVNMAASANMNMIRVWGGGTYPDDIFYEECMKKGIMIWQDFMFACAMYPGNDEFKWNMGDEANYQFERLKNYNHIATWCGNNEEGWKNWGWQKDLHLSSKDSTLIWNNYVEIFQHELKEITAQYDSLTPYISTSPKHGWGRKESMTDGDSHYWGVWWGLEPIEKYNEKIPRFMSEFGMQGMPDLSTLKKVIPDYVMNFQSPEFRNHQKHPTGFQTLDHYLKEYFVVPGSMDDYAYITQVLQAYSLTTAIEAQRRAMPHCMGSLIWQLNDCWPVTSWSLIDYDLKPKIAYYEVSEAYKPVIISVKEETSSYDVYIINDGSKNEWLDLEVNISDFYGQVKWKKTTAVKVNSNTSKKYLSISKTDLAGFDLSTVFMKSTVHESVKTKKQYLHLFDMHFFHFVKPNELKLPPPDFKFTLDENNQVFLNTSVYCPYTRIPVDLKNFESYLGNLVPGNYPLFYGDVNMLQQLEKNTSGIKCLNSILNNH